MNPQSNQFGLGGQKQEVPPKKPSFFSSLIKGGIKEGGTQALKKGFKKAGTWLSMKLGKAAAIKTLTQAAGAALSAAVAPVTGGLSFVVSALVNVGLSLLSFGKRALKKLSEKPESLMVVGVSLIGLGFMISLPFSIAFWGIGGLFLSSGAVLAFPGLVAGSQAAIGGFFSQVASFPATFFASLAAMTAGTAITLLVLGVIGGLSLATFFQVMTTSSAFILANKPPPEVGEEVTFGTPSKVLLVDKDGHLAAQVIYFLNQCGISNVYSGTWEETVECLRTASLPGDTEALINQFRYSVFSVGPGLQCVGFVRGVLAALGLGIDCGGHAKEFLSCPGVETDMTRVQVGDVIIKSGSTYGHIAFLVGKEQVERDGVLITVFRVAQADGTKNGWVGFTIFENDSDKLIGFDGFIRL